MIRAHAKIVTPGFRLTATLDPDGNKFPRCAQAARAAYLATDNRRRVPAQWKWVAAANAPALVELLAAEFSR
jgi:hypothetical protein